MFFVCFFNNIQISCGDFHSARDICRFLLTTAAICICVLHFFCFLSYFSLFMVTVTVSAARVWPWVPPESVQGQFPSDILQLRLKHFFCLRASLAVITVILSAHRRWSSSPFEIVAHRTLPGKCTICVQLCRLNILKKLSGAHGAVWQLKNTVWCEEN